MAEDRHIQLAADFLSVGFELKLNAPDYEKLKDALAVRLTFLINDNFEGLLQLLYRIDVDEQKARDALADVSLEEGVKLLAELVIKRQVEKIKSREEHKSDKESDDAELN